MAVMNTSFANILLLFNVMCLLMAALRIATAAELKVGDDKGWIIGCNYTTWAASKDFQSGDTLLFKYNKSWHDVVQVTKSDYDSCKAGSPLVSYKSGNDTVTLSKPGSYYYLCGVPGHCEAGQKVALVVLAAATPHSAPSHAPSSSPLAPAPKKSKSGPAPKKSKSAPSPSPAHKSSSSSPSPAPKSSISEKAGPSPSKSLNRGSVLSPSSSKNSAHTLSAGLALLAVMWAFSALFFSL